MRADKAKVVDEVWDEERIESFLTKGPMAGESKQFSQLLHAYRSMRVDDFERFIERFVAAGGDISSTDTRGQTLAECIKNHRKAAPFLAVLAR